MSISCTHIPKELLLLLAIYMLSGGSEICLHGWESCKDGTCEPFHWLCEEHDSQPIGVPVIGR